MFEIQYYSDRKSKIIFLKIYGEIQKNFIIKNFEEFPFLSHKLMIEVNKLDDYFDNKSFIREPDEVKKFDYELISLSKDKFSLLFQLDGSLSKFSSYSPFWGKITKNKIWIAISS